MNPGVQAFPIPVHAAVETGLSFSHRNPLEFRRTPMRFLSLLIVTLLAQSPVRPSGLSGIVVKQETGAPLSRATVILQSDAIQYRGYTVITSPDGKFSFDDVIPGRYRLAVTRDGYVPAEIGTAGPEGCGAPIMVEAGLQRTDLSIAMAPAGAISGRLYDREGEPAANVPVQAIKSTYQNGGRVLTSVQTTQTNDMGEYRLFYLPPGRYLVGAAPENRTAMGYTDERVTAGGTASAANPSALTPRHPPAPTGASASPAPPMLPGRFMGRSSDTFDSWAANHTDLLSVFIGSENGNAHRSAGGRNVSGSRHDHHASGPPSHQREGSKRRFPRGVWTRWRSALDFRYRSTKRGRRSLHERTAGRQL